MAIAVSKIVRPLQRSSIGTCLEGTSLLQKMKIRLKDQRGSELMDKMGSSNLFRQFSSDLTSSLNPYVPLLYDTTSFPSYLSAEILEYGHAKVHRELEHLN
ncbi:MAG: hypothetical protein LVQ96_05510 [Thermoplasmatales archaeon]|nr:hypothetical protein [Thermoplasmatales archaeon]MCW6170609.1 hypothetical protein [Thermoplasmatales archaeon]